MRQAGESAGAQYAASARANDQRAGAAASSAGRRSGPGRLQRGHAMAAFGQVFQPLAEEGVHAHAVADQFRRRRIQPHHVLPAAADVAMRGLGLARVAVQAHVGRRVRLAGERIA
jgi:hypothetical protein